LVELLNDEGGDLGVVDISVVLAGQIREVDEVRGSEGDRR
jgi:hypothetical protein